MENPEKNDQKPPDFKKKGRSPWLALGGAGLTMGITIWLAAWGGKKLDAMYPFDSGKKWWTIGMTMLGVAISLYNLLKQVNQINKSNSDK